MLWLGLCQTYVSDAKLAILQLNIRWLERLWERLPCTCQSYPNQHLFASDICTLMLQLRLSSTTMISLTDLAPTKRQGKVVTFGPYSDTPAYAFSPFSVHFENNNPFIRVTKLTRELEVSHWGNVYVDEKYYIRYMALVYSVRKVNLTHGWDAFQPAITLPSSPAVCIHNANQRQQCACHSNSLAVCVQQL